MDLRERFNQYLYKTANCWFWIGFVDNLGYGRIWTGGSSKLAHVISYKLHVGEFADGLFVLHKCSMRQCINPEHLYLGTHIENAADSAKEGTKDTRSFMTHCKYGHEYTQENTKFRIQDGTRICLKCRDRWNEESNQRRKNAKQGAHISI